MVNVTIIKGKDILKYIVKAIIILLILFIFKLILANSSNDKNVKLSKLTQNIDLKQTIKENIPILEQTSNDNFDDKKDVNEKIINPLTLVVSSQLNAMNYLEEKKIETDNQNENEEIQQAEVGLETKVIENNIPTKFTNLYNNVKVRNETEYQLTEQILEPNIEVNNQNVLIFHTHTCESYTPSEKYNYEQTGIYRTTDVNYNVVRVGTELSNQLESYGYKTIHDETYHDYPAYNGSYGRSLETVKNLLVQNNNTDVVIDIHRDAIGDYSYAPTVVIGEDEVAQLMFVIGTDGSGLEHDNWQQNLKFAVKVQQKAEELYPGLFKPIILRNSRYNQHLTKAACIIEVGATRKYYGSMFE